MSDIIYKFLLGTRGDEKTPEKQESAFLWEHDQSQFRKLSL